MKIKAIGFDIGGTLVNYNKPLNWSASYEDAIKFMCKENNLQYSIERFNQAKQVFEKYNTRVNPREFEVSSDVIFGEIFDIWKENKNKIFDSKKSFYLFFQREAFLYDDVFLILQFCKDNNIKTAVYTDVAYGMDDEGTELVFTMFTGPDDNKYVSLFGFDNNSDEGDVICGQYEATTEVDEEGDEWTYFDVEDVYTGKHFNLGVCERPETEEIVFYDSEGSVISGKFLTAAETIQYMGSAVSLIDK